MARGKGYKIVFYNVAGLGNKDRNFWEILEDWDIIVCTETCVKERSWKRTKKINCRKSLDGKLI